jgi:glycosyltransferase involved in cell wall biosynthesis
MFPIEEDGQAFRQELRLGDKFVITYAGALGMANAIGTILRAAERLRDEPRIHFVLVGDGKERPRLEQQAGELALQNVTFAGSRPKSDMAQVLAGSDACVATLQNIPLFSTTYPNKIFDYMAARRPTILGIDGVIREVVEAADAGIFVPPGDDVRLAQAVRDLFAHRDEARSMGQRGRAYVVEHFNRHAQAADFAALVHRLTGSPVVADEAPVSV